MAELLIEVLADSETRTEHKYHDYHPVPLPTSSRHGIYSANIVLLTLALEPVISVRRLFRASYSSNDPPGMWHRRVLLWRSAMTEPDWTDLGLSISIRHRWVGDIRDLEISLSGTPRTNPEPIDPYWHYGYPPTNPNRYEAQWHRPYWGAIFHKMDISGGTNDSAVRHAVEPLFRWIGASITTFHGSGTGHASSIAHDLMHLWLSRALDPENSNLASAYDRLAIVFDSRPLWDAQMQVDVVKLVLHFLKLDAAQLPAATVIHSLRAAMDLANGDDRVLELILEAALSALRVRSEDDTLQDALTQIVSEVLSALKNHNLPTALLAWIILHREGSAYVHLFYESPQVFIARIAHLPIQESHPNLLEQASRLIEQMYPSIGTIGK